MNIQAKVAIDKQKHPERFCPVPMCLWKVVRLEHDTQAYFPRNDSPGGYCPSHQNMRPKVTEEARLAMIESLGGFLSHLLDLVTKEKKEVSRWVNL
jgi:hypothetical protein